MEENLVKKLREAQAFIEEKKDLIEESLGDGEVTAFKFFQDRVEDLEKKTNG